MRTAALWTVCLALLCLGGCAGSPYQLSKMTSQEIGAADSTDLCYAALNIRRTGDPLRLDVIDAEVKRRGLNCNRMSYAGYVVDPRTPMTPSGPVITNSTSPECRGLRVIAAGPSYILSGIVPVLFVRVENTSGRRKTITLDVQKYSGGSGNPYFDNSATGWQQIGPEVIRAEERTVNFNAGVGVGSADRILKVNVVGCGG